MYQKCHHQISHWPNLTFNSLSIYKHIYIYIYIDFKFLRHLPVSNFLCDLFRENQIQILRLLS